MTTLEQAYQIGFADGYNHQARPDDYPPLPLALLEWLDRTGQRQLTANEEQQLYHWHTR